MMTPETLKGVLLDPEILQGFRSDKDVRCVYISADGPDGPNYEHFDMATRFMVSKGYGDGDGFGPLDDRAAEDVFTAIEDAIEYSLAAARRFGLPLWGWDADGCYELVLAPHD